MDIISAAPAGVCTGQQPTIHALEKDEKTWLHRVMLNLKYGGLLKF